jgi:hypothetical protein
MLPPPKIKLHLKPGMVAHICSPSIRRLKQEVQEFKGSLGCLARPCFRTREYILYFNPRHAFMSHISYETKLL